MKLNTRIQTNDFAKKNNVPIWKVEKIMYELNTNDSILLTNFFTQNTFENKIKEIQVRLEEIAVYLQNSRTISREEFHNIHIRNAHLKEDAKNFLEDFAYLKPNAIAHIKEYFYAHIEELKSMKLSQERFIQDFEEMLLKAFEI